MMKPTENRLRITEIFHSLQGESTTVGLPTVFIRLTGCPLRCHYCDTEYAFSGGTLFSLEDIMKKVASFNCQHVCVTGGEPLAQPNCKLLLQILCETGYTVSLETSGALSLEDIDERVMIVMDLKTPDSGEHHNNKLSNLPFLKKRDQIKFVLCTRDDYLWACDMLKKHQLHEVTQILFSPSYGQLAPTDLANWIVQDQLPVRFQIQLHKLLWNDVPGF